MTADVDSELTDFERAQVDAAQRWVREEPSLPERALARIGDRTQAALQRLLASQRVAAAIEDATTRVLRELDDQLRHDLDDDAAMAEPTTRQQRSEVLGRANERAEQVRRNHTRRLAAHSAVAGAASVNLAAAVLAVAADVAIVVRGGLRAAAHTLNVFGTPVGHPALVPAAVEIAVIAGDTDPQRRRTTLLEVVGKLTGDDHAGVARAGLPRVIAQQTGTRALIETLEQVVRRSVQRRSLRMIPFLGGAASVATSWHEDASATPQDMQAGSPTSPDTPACRPRTGSTSRTYTSKGSRPPTANTHSLPELALARPDDCTRLRPDRPPGGPGPGGRNQQLIPAATTAVDENQRRYRGALRLSQCSATELR